MPQFYAKQILDFDCITDASAAGIANATGIIARMTNSSRANNIVILISGSGSNMQAIVRRAQQANWPMRYEARIAAVISNRPNAKGLAWAQVQGIPTHVLNHQDYANREAFDAALKNTLDTYQPRLVVLAGFMRILGADFVAHYEGRLINIHPSLLPAFQGLHTHERAIAAGCRFAGATVHRVTPVLDEGEILAQAVVPVLSNDNAQSLAARVLTQEHVMYPQAIEALLQQATSPSLRDIPPIPYLCTPNNS